MNELNVFISHIHENKKIADVVSKHLKEWGVNGELIFQSTDPGGGLTTGSSIKDELQKRLEKTNLLILIYTGLESNADWSYCMWECGIAEGKSTVPTRTVVFQCTQEEPTVFKDELRIFVSATDTSSQNEVRRFVEDFHKKTDFIPINDSTADFTQGLAPETTDELISTRSERFYEELKDEIPSGTSSSRHMWDFIRLSLDSSHIEKIEAEEDKEKIITIIKENFELLTPNFETVGDTGGSVGTALKQFGFAGFEEGLKLQDVVENWRKQDTTKDVAWIDELYESIFRSLTNAQSEPIGNMMKSVRIGVDWWFLPVVTRMRIDRDNNCEFDLYLILAKHRNVFDIKTVDDPKIEGGRPSEVVGGGIPISPQSHQ